jgi:hypothetical protein
LIGQSISFRELPKNYFPGTGDRWGFILTIQIMTWRLFRLA